MSIDLGAGTAQVSSEINVTPLIDVLLVLLTIFMVIVPVAPSGLSTLIPQPSLAGQAVSETLIVLQVLANGDASPIYRINETSYPKSQIEPELASIFATRNNKVMFVKGDGSLQFSEIVEVIDMGHRANVDSIGLLTPRSLSR